MDLRQHTVNMTMVAKLRHLPTPESHTWERGYSLKRLRSPSNYVLLANV